MHVKIVVADGTVYLGSYNFSRSGEENAENLLRVQSQELADVCVAYIDRVSARYAVEGSAG
jgi:phosphatidylserine/phosphatidylglycerophosphate/cardiolipin synthase-like enzyme